MSSCGEKCCATTLNTAGSRLRRNPCEGNHRYSVFSVDFTHYYGMAVGLIREENRKNVSSKLVFLNSKVTLQAP